jgi:hypothetical protein
MKILLRFDTDIGPRVVCVEGGDKETATAIAEAHRFSGNEAAVLDDEGRFDMREHLRKQKDVLLAAKAAAATALLDTSPNVTAIKRKKT